MSMNIPNTNTVATIHLYSMRSVVRRTLTLSSVSVMSAESCTGDGVATLVPRSRLGGSGQDRHTVVDDDGVAVPERPERKLRLQEMLDGDVGSLALGMVRAPVRD